MTGLGFIATRTPGHPRLVTPAKRQKPHVYEENRPRPHSWKIGPIRTLHNPLTCVRTCRKRLRPLTNRMTQLRATASFNLIPPYRPFLKEIL